MCVIWSGLEFAKGRVGLLKSLGAVGVDVKRSLMVAKGLDRDCG